MGARTHTPHDGVVLAVLTATANDNSADTVVTGLLIKWPPSGTVA